jgi:hypothetical protein
MNEIDEYNYCLAQIEQLKEKLRNMGFVYDERHGWYNYYNRPLSKAQQDEIDDTKMKFQKYSEYSGNIRKKLGF